MRAAAAVALAAAGIALAGCGSADTGTADLAAGEQTFKNLCSSCHTPGGRRHGRRRTSGPAWTTRSAPSRQVGMSDEQFKGVVRRWIEIAQQPMPRDLVVGEDADNVAAYIASVAGKSADSTPFPYQSTPAVPDPPRQQPHQDD